ncbi:MAG: hypothetical protein AB7U73_01115 [Pirellulales bacterium]
MGRAKQPWLFGDQLLGLPGKPTKHARRCPNCGVTFFRTICPRRQCVLDGQLTKTKPLKRRRKLVRAADTDVGRIAERPCTVHR